MSSKKKIWGSNFSPEEIEEARTNNRLLSMELELSLACNLRCVYCYSEAGEKSVNELTLEEIYDILDQAIALGARRIIVLGGGEPMMYPHVMEIIRSLSSRGIVVDLFSNATLITREIADELFALGVHPVVKMNSMKDDVQDLLAGKKGVAPSIRQGMENLRAAGYPTKELPLGVQTVVCRQNLEELPEMWAWIRERNMVPYFEMLTDQGRACKNLDITVTPEQLKKAFTKLSVLDSERFGYEWEPHPPIAGLRCNRHAYTCTVTVHGDIIPCPGVNLSCGNIRQTPLAEILRTSTVIRDLRNIRETIKGACRECEQLDVCYGCRGMAYQATGDYLAADPICWKNGEGKG